MFDPCSLRRGRYPLPRPMAATAMVGLGALQVHGGVPTSAVHQPLTTPLAQATTAFNNIIDTVGFRPRWQTGDWSVTHGWLQIAGDLAICLGCVLTFVVLIGFVRRRAGTPSATLFWPLGALILGCGLV